MMDWINFYKVKIALVAVLCFVCCMPKTHGMRSSPEYRIWNGMKQRCLNENHPAFSKYGGSGITVHSSWLTFENFLNDVGLRPSPDHSLDRFPNQKGNYEPGNVRWATWKQQNGNRTDNVVVEYNGVQKTLLEWCSELGLPYERTYQRVKKCGWSAKDAFEIGGDKNTITFQGRTLSVKAWSKELNKSYHTLLSRMRKGWSPEKILS